MQIQLIYGEIGDGLLLLYSHYIDNAIDDIAIIYIYIYIDKDIFKKKKDN